MSKLARLSMLSVLSAAASAALAPLPAPALAGQPAPGEPGVVRCIHPEAIDGDTIRCGQPGQRISHRLLGIDAPEMPGHCRTGRACAPGDPFASRAALARLLAGGGVTVQSFGTDRYGRQLSIARARDGLNLSCAQLDAGQALFMPNWDKARRIANECGR